MRAECCHLGKGLVKLCRTSACRVEGSKSGRSAWLIERHFRDVHTPTCRTAAARDPVAPATREKTASMSRICFVNGAFVPCEAAIPIMDRGFLFADGIYEVAPCSAERSSITKRISPVRPLARRDPHPEPTAPPSGRGLCQGLVRRNNLVEGLVYMQVTRGVAERDFAFPRDAAPTVVMFTQAKTIARSPQAETGSPSSPCRTCAGSAATSSRCRSCRRCLPSRRRRKRGSPKPGWWRTAL